MRNDQVRRVGVVALAMVLGTALGACSDSKKQPNSTGSTLPAGSLLIDMRDPSAFVPTKLDVKNGVSVTVIAKNSGALPHTFTIKDFNADSGIVNGGDSKPVTFTPNKTGSIKFICTLHESTGMVGTLNVT